MTKVTITFDLTAPLDERLLNAVADIHKIYGINSVELEPAMKDITVDYDASRLSPKDVEAALRRAGLPIARP